MVPFCSGGYLIIKSEDKEGFSMIDKMDKALADLTEMAIDMVENAKAKQTFNKEFVEAVCIIFSMAYGRFSDDK